MIILPPEIITIIIEASFNQSNPYLTLDQIEDSNVFYQFCLVSKKFRQDSRRILVNSLNLTEGNINSVKETLVGMFDEKEESLVRFIKRIYIGEFVRGTANLIEEALNLEELWIECSGSNGVSLILEIPKCKLSSFLCRSQEKIFTCANVKHFFFFFITFFSFRFQYSYSHFTFT